MGRLPVWEASRILLAVEKEGLYRIAKETGLGYGNLYHYKQGTAGISMGTADKLAAYLGLKLCRDKTRRRK